MLINLLLILAALVVVFVIVVATRPSTFRVERSITVSAPPSAVFPHLSDLRKSQVWSPWVKLDPAATHTFEGPPAGVGASHAWSGNNKMGAGRQTIIECRQDELVRTKLEFLRPFKATSESDLVLKPAGGGTVVTWGLSGRNDFLSKAFCLFMNQDKMIGTSFEEGLASLKGLVERPAAV